VSRPLGVLLEHAGDDLGRLTTVALAVQLARGERRLATQPPRTTDPHVANLHGALLDTTGIYQLSDAERALISERGLSQWSECRHLLPGATSVVQEAAEATSARQDRSNRVAATGLAQRGASAPVDRGAAASQSARDQPIGGVVPPPGPTPS
jgi:hypothetical protein